MTKLGSCASEATRKQVPRRQRFGPEAFHLEVKTTHRSNRSAVQNGLHPSTVTSRLITNTDRVVTSLDDSRLSLTLSPVAGLLATSSGQPAAPPLGGSGGLQHGRQVHRSLLLP